jgi:hypothetical protein
MKYIGHRIFIFTDSVAGPTLAALTSFHVKPDSIPGIPN